MFLNYKMVFLKSASRGRRLVPSVNWSLHLNLFFTRYFIFILIFAFLIQLRVEGETRNKWTEDVVWHAGSNQTCCHCCIVWFDFKLDSDSSADFRLDLDLSCDLEISWLTQPSSNLIYPRWPEAWVGLVLAAAPHLLEVKKRLCV